MELSSNSEPWRPPSRSGLSNSEPIIPSYYIKKWNFFIIMKNTKQNI